MERPPSSHARIFPSQYILARAIPNSPSPFPPPSFIAKAEQELQTAYAAADPASVSPGEVTAWQAVCEHALSALQALLYVQRPALLSVGRCDGESLLTLTLWYATNFPISSTSLDAAVDRFNELGLLEPVVTAVCAEGWLNLTQALAAGLRMGDLGAGVACGAQLFW